MGRRRRENSVENILKRRSKGRGAKTDNEYTPGIFTYEIPSKGKVARVKGITDNRTYHCLSQIEKHYLILLENDPLVTEIQEQIFLVLADTLQIAQDLGYKHPQADGCATEMSTDFFFCKKDKWYAVAIKTKKDAAKKRVKEKLEIERVYWEQRNVQWVLVTEEDIPRRLVANLQWLNSGEPFEETIPDPELRQSIIDSFMELYQNCSVSFKELVDAMEDYYNLRSGTIMQLFKHLIREKTIELDLNQPINWIDPRKAIKPLTTHGIDRT